MREGGKEGGGGRNTTVMGVSMLVAEEIERDCAPIMVQSSAWFCCDRILYCSIFSFPGVCGKRPVGSLDKQRRWSAIHMYLYSYAICRKKSMM